MTPRHYDILEVRHNASAEVINAACRALSKKYHPDMNPAPEATAHFKRIRDAYDVLSDPRQRARYDDQLKASGNDRTSTPPQSSHAPPHSSTHSNPPPSDTKEITLPGGVKHKLIWCPPGTFTMGTPGATDDERPVQVTLTNGFRLGETVITQAMWTAVMGTASKPWSGKEYVKEGPNFPATYISHGANSNGTIEPDSATAFCKKLTEIERKSGRLPSGWRYALPTEAQWEYACRAGTKTAYSFGDDDERLGQYAWFTVNAWHIGEKYAHVVGTKKPNPWGLYDMHGNVWEWCSNWCGDKLAGGTNPGGPSSGSDRVDRGGGWSYSAGFCRSAFRGGDDPSRRYYDLGFRLCLSSD